MKIDYNARYRRLVPGYSTVKCVSIENQSPEHVWHVRYEPLLGSEHISRAVRANARFTVQKEDRSDHWVC